MVTTTGKVERLQGGVNVIGYFKGQLGLGETARLIVSALEAQSIPFSLISADAVGPHHSKVAECSYSFEETGKYATNLFCVGNDDLAFFLQWKGIQLIKDRYNICLFFWETDLIPKDKLQMLSCFDEVWVTTHYNHECLSAATTTPVHLIPHPIRLNYSQKIPDKASFGLDKRFLFLFCFDFYGIFQRKNPTALIEAFQRAFPQRNDVQLVIKSHNGHKHPHLLNPVLDKIKGDSRITWIDESMSFERRYDLINACDCYVSLHRSEGFGLSLAEAMLLEKPVIATGYSGNLDFTTPENSYLCGYKLVPIGPNHRPYPANGVWADVNIDEAASWMLHVVNNPAEAMAKARRGKEDIQNNLSLEKVGNSIKKRLRDIDEESNSAPRKAKHRKFYIRSLLVILKYYCRGVVQRSEKLFTRNSR